MPTRLILIGASVRAAAQSAIRGGFAPCCADLFADRDLAAIAPARRVRRYPAGLIAALDEAPSAAPVMYTGALENYPRLIDALVRRRTLWGNCGSVLREVRNPRRVFDSLQSAGLRVPLVAESAAALPLDGTWLCKPIRSGGGWQIDVWDEASAAAQRSNSAAAGHSPRRRGGCYFQQRIDGLSCSALYVAAHGECRLLGVTRQLVGSEWGAGPFSYAGSIGPLSLPAHKNATFRRIGDCLAGEFQLVGVFGVDAIVNDAGVWPVEVNPRYPASAEVLERAGNFSAISMHAAACADGLLPSEPLFAERIVGKAILFATLKQCVPLELTEWTERVNRDATWPRVADIPAAGNMLVPGAPVLTLLSEGDDAQQLETKLQQRLAETRQYLG